VFICVHLWFQLLFLANFAAESATLQWAARMTIEDRSSAADFGFRSLGFPSDFWFRAFGLSGPVS
jgi:hypothetical protein